MLEKKDADRKAQPEPHRKPDRDGEEASVSPINPPPADGGKVRGDGDSPAGPVL